MSASKRIRSTNYTIEDTYRLAELVLKYADTVENKRTDAAMWRDKTRIWQKIGLEFNADSCEKRTAEQLRQKYESLKKGMRKEMVKEKQEMEVARNGEVEVKIVTMNPITEMLRHVVTMSAAGSKNTNECDDSLSQPSLQGREDKVLTAYSEHGYGTKCSDLDWDNASEDEKFLPSVPSVSSNALDELSISRAVEDVFGPESQDEAEKPKSSLQKQMNHRDVWSLKRKEVDLEERKKTCFARRNKLFSKSSGLKKTASKQLLWSNVRRELTQLQKKVLVEESAVRERREQELHERQLAMFTAAEERERELHGLNVRLLKLRCKKVEKELMELS